MGNGILAPPGGYKATLRSVLAQARRGFACADAGLVKASEQAMAALAAGALDNGCEGIARKAARAWTRTLNRRLDRAGM